MQHAGKRILLDIEGTTSSIQFVFEVMFPYARRELDLFLVSHWEEETVQAACDQIARDAGMSQVDDWEPDADDATLRRHLRDEVVKLMESDSKTTGLKQLQGLIWRSGFENGELKAHVYEDVPPALSQWQEKGVELRIYSSGSIAAQKLFFAHTIAGDLLGNFSGHYDTTTGPKRETASYEAIAQDFGGDPGDILFLSDVVAELDAAKNAGLNTGLSVRPGNPKVASDHGHAEITSFHDVLLG